MCAIQAWRWECPHCSVCVFVCMCVHASDVHDTTGLAHLQTIADHVRSWLLVVDGATDGHSSKEYHW